MIDLLSDYCKKIELDITDTQLQQFDDYYRFLVKKNKVMNLTTIIEKEDVVLKHFIDSIYIMKYTDFDEKKVIDIGTGAGFPGIPLKILRPDIKVTLVDSLNKRINFLNEVIEKLNLEDIVTVHSRIEDFGKNKSYREKFDYVTARAVANLAVLSEYLIPIAKIGGKCVCMKGSNVEEEIESGKKAINVLGGKLERVDEFKLPDSDISRNVIVLSKVKNTPVRFPRKAGMPSKEPLK